MPAARDLSKMLPAAARKAALRYEQRMERVRAAVAYMDKHVGRGWPKAMERAGVMCDDIPKSWLVDRKRPSERTLVRLERYAASFGYVPSALEAKPRADVAASLSQWNLTQN